MTKIAEQYRSRGEFLSQVHGTLTANSVFLPLKPPFPKLDTTIELDLSVHGEGPLLRGTAHVVECRIGHGGTGLAPGIGLHLLQLDPASQRQLPELIAEAKQRTGSVLDLVQNTFGREAQTALPEGVVARPLPKAGKATATATGRESNPPPTATPPSARKKLFPGLRRRPGKPPRAIPLPVFSLMIAGALSSIAYLAYRPVIDYLGGFGPTDAVSVVGASVVNDIPRLDIQPSVDPEERLGEVSNWRSGSDLDAEGVPVLEPLPITAPSSVGPENDPTDTTSASAASAASARRPSAAPNPAPATSAPGGVERISGAKAEKNLRPFDQIKLISWKETPEGAVVTLWCNGQSRPADIVHQRLGGKTPRELLKLRGVDTPYRYSALATELEAVPRIRTGFHPQPVANELHVVLDLARPTLRLTRIETDGTRIHLFLVEAPTARKAAAAER